MWNDNLEDIVVVKRSGQRVEFNASKIAIAIKKGFEAVYDKPSGKDIFKVFKSVLSYINNFYKDRKTINVEDIQDIIENELKKQKFDEVYNAYHNYRERRMASRKVFSEKQEHKFIRAMEKLNDEESKLLNSTTPKDTLIKFGSIISSEYVKAYTLDSKTLRALEEGLIYIHNLDYFSLGFIEKLNLKIIPKLADKCLVEFINEIERALDEVSDEVCISTIDLVLENYLLENYKDFLINYLEKYLSFSGFIDFVPIKRYLDVIRKCNSIDEIEDYIMNISSNNAIKNIVYKSIIDADEELEICISSFIKRILSIKSKNAKLTIGLSASNAKIPSIIKSNIFKELENENYNKKIHIIFDISKDLENVNTISKLILKEKNVSIKKANTNCFQDGTILCEGINGEKDGIGRMVSASVSLNMTRIALKCANKDKKDFYEELDNAIELVKNSILLEFETLGNKNRENYDVLFRGNILGDERLAANQKIRKIIKSGTLNFGLIGLYECVCLLENDDKDRFKTLIKVLDHLRKKCDSYREEYKLNFALFEPSDKLSHSKLIEYDKSIYNILKGITDKDSYSLLSEHLSENEMLKVQEYLQCGYLLNTKISTKTNVKDIEEILKNFNKRELNHIGFKRSTS